MLYGRKLLRAVHLGVKNLLLHKLRSLLTMLGIIFGVCSVISMLAIGEGANEAALQTLRRLGDTNIIIEAVKPSQDEDASSSGNSFAIAYGLTYLDAERIRRSVPGVSEVLPMRRLRQDVAFSGRQAPCMVVGTSPAHARMLEEPVTRGRFLSATDEKHRVNVCVLSVGMAERLFPYQNPLDESVRIAGDYYRVVGVIGHLDRQARTWPDEQTGRSWQDEVYLPLATVRSMFGETVVRRTSGSTSAETVQLHRMIVQVEDTSMVEPAARSIQHLLETFHDKKDYEMQVPLRLLREAERTERLFNAVLGSIAAISLLVGGIGIMNIMLATVTERTREIGVRRALGAKRRDITAQFLVETLVMSVGGGAVGVAMGLIVPRVVSYLVPHMPTIVTWWALALAFSTSVLVGVIFGIYPAYRAANLDPIQALRHE